MIAFPLWVLVEILRVCGEDLINSIAFIDLFSLGGLFSHIRRNSLFIKSGNGMGQQTYGSYGAVAWSRAKGAGFL